MVVAGLVSALLGWPFPTRVHLVAGAAAFRPVVVEVGQGVVAGSPGGTVAGPAALVVRFPRPTTAGDLLVAAISDGVLTSGMHQPRWHPAGWRLAASVIGGNTADGGTGGYATGGLQAAIFYRTDSPAGITMVRLGTEPAGTAGTDTAEVVELSGLPGDLSVTATGTSTSGPSPATDSHRSTVATSAVPSRLPALVLALFDNGGTSPSGERWVRPSRWRVIGENPGLDNQDQPLLLDEAVWRSDRPPNQTIGFYGGSAIDSCAVMVALSA